MSDTQVVHAEPSSTKSLSNCVIQKDRILSCRDYRQDPWLENSDTRFSGPPPSDWFIALCFTAHNLKCCPPARRTSFLDSGKPPLPCEIIRSNSAPFIVHVQTRDFYSLLERLVKSRGKKRGKFIEKQAAFVY